MNRRLLVAGLAFVVATALTAVAFATPHSSSPPRHIGPPRARLQTFELVDSAAGPSRLAATGTTPEFGRYVAVGELTFTSSEESGAVDGTGIAVVQAEDGDKIVADVTFNVQEGGALTFHWRDSVEFSDGTVANSTGRFVESKPPGLIVTTDCTHYCIVSPGKVTVCTVTCFVCHDSSPYPCGFLNYPSCEKTCAVSASQFPLFR